MEAIHDLVEAITSNVDQQYQNDVQLVAPAANDMERFEAQRQQIQEALNRQTYHQFRAYAQQQFVGDPIQCPAISAFRCLDDAFQSSSIVYSRKKHLALSFTGVSCLLAA
ncbi:unnamed protein product [Gongylonema pulchrum]|uniref:CACTA en-spm transposon protein n=1 Tax=Gongylonema pulchrum TaxID=637853 RepID=A0A183EQL9_9BILA|nr:unnamed protein product [Gongylonema pulchrum]